MRRPLYLSTLCALVLVACGDKPKAGEEPTRAADAPASAEQGAPAGAAPSDAVAPAGSTPIEITAVVDGREMAVSGLGECQHAADGSIYARPASLWAARYNGPESGDLHHLNLTFWRERSGMEAVNMALEVGSAVHRIATVQGGEQHGSGTAQLEGDASAGTLVVNGTTAEGKAVRVRAKCSRFTTMVAEGG